MIEIKCEQNGTDRREKKMAGHRREAKSEVQSRKDKRKLSISRHRLSCLRKGTRNFCQDRMPISLLGVGI
jgi:hypothetical protein